LQLAGDLDIASAPELRETLLHAVQEVTNGTLVLDFSEVTFMDATAVGVLVGAHRRLAQYGGRLQIEGAPSYVRRILRATRAEYLIGE
jgi:anti-anti-sigma factor